jgi:hypothetical protein
LEIRDIILIIIRRQAHGRERVIFPDTACATIIRPLIFATTRGKLEYAGLNITRIKSRNVEQKYRLEISRRVLTHSILTFSYKYNFSKLLYLFAKLLKTLLSRLQYFRMLSKEDYTIKKF